MFGQPSPSRTPALELQLYHKLPSNLTTDQHSIDLQASPSQPPVSLSVSHDLRLLIAYNDKDFQGSARTSSTSTVSPIDDRQLESSGYGPIRDWEERVAFGG